MIIIFYGDVREYHDGGISRDIDDRLGVADHLSNVRAFFRKVWWLEDWTGNIIGISDEIIRRSWTKSVSLEGFES